MPQKSKAFWIFHPKQSHRPFSDFRSKKTGLYDALKGSSGKFSNSDMGARCWLVLEHWPNSTNLKSCLRWLETPCSWSSFWYRLFQKESKERVFDPTVLLIQYKLYSITKLIFKCFNQFSDISLVHGKLTINHVTLAF